MSDKLLGLQDIKRGEAAVQRASGIHAPPALEHGGVEVAEVHGERRVAVTIETREPRRQPIETAPHPAA